LRGTDVEKDEQEKRREKKGKGKSRLTSLGRYFSEARVLLPGVLAL